MRKVRVNSALLWCATLYMWAAVAGATDGGPVQRLGVLSLQGGFPLSTAWQFRPGDDPGWASPEYDHRAWQQRSVPGRWPGGGFPQTGQMAWYRISLQLDLHDAGDRRDLPLLGIRTGQVMSAFELYAGGELVGRVGKLPPQPEIQYDRARVFAIPHRAIDADGRLVLAMRVWGGDQAMVDHWYGGPYRGEFQVGNASGPAVTWDSGRADTER